MALLSSPNDILQLVGAVSITLTYTPSQQLYPIELYPSVIQQNRPGSVNVHEAVPLSFVKPIVLYLLPPTQSIPMHLVVAPDIA